MKIRSKNQIDKDIACQSKICGNCKKKKNFEEFYKCNRYRDGRMTTCKECRKRYAKNKQSKYNRKYQRSYHLKKKYNITIKEFQQMMTKQKGKCAICGSIESSNRYGPTPLHVDHCHKSGQVRGLLCGNCNKALGLLQDNIELLDRAKEYLNGELKYEENREVH